MKTFREYLAEAKIEKINDTEKIKKQITAYFKSDTINSVLIDKNQIDINFKNKHFILGQKDLKFLNGIDGFKIDSIHNFEQSGITILLTK